MAHIRSEFVLNSKLVSQSIHLVHTKFDQHSTLQRKEYEEYKQTTQSTEIGVVGYHHAGNLVLLVDFEQQIHHLNRIFAAKTFQ